MHFQDWFRSLHTSTEGTDSDNTRSLWPSLPSSSFVLSRRSLLGLGAVASLTAYYLVMRPRPMHPPCNLQAQSVPVNVSVRQQRRAEMLCERPTLLRLFVCREIPAAGARLSLKMIRCWTFTTKIPGRTTTCSNEDCGSQVASIIIDLIPQVTLANTTDL